MEPSFPTPRTRQTDVDAKRSVIIPRPIVQVLIVLPKISDHRNVNRFRFRTRLVPFENQSPPINVEVQCRDYFETSEISLFAVVFHHADIVLCAASPFLGRGHRIAGALGLRRVEPENGEV